MGGFDYTPVDWLSFKSRDRLKKKGHNFKEQKPIIGGDEEQGSLETHTYIHVWATLFPSFSCPSHSAQQKPIAGWRILVLLKESLKVFSEVSGELR